MFTLFSSMLECKHFKGGHLVLFTVLALSLVLAHSKRLINSFAVDIQWDLSLRVKIELHGPYKKFICLKSQ
jgi:hypothetical protein